MIVPDVQLICIPPESARRLWSTVFEMIDGAFATFDMAMPADILDQLDAGTRLLWLAVAADTTIQAAMLTQLFEMRSGKVCKMLECGGENMRSWLPLRSGIEEYAKREDCVRVIIEGRPGWSRLLPDYKMIGITLEKRI